jgi:hypothetical protein
MATTFDSLKGIVHDTTAALIDHDITKKVSDLVTTSMKSGFDIMEDVLTIVRDLTA